jgi:tRNA-dihydrouridine synthase B
MFAPMHGVGSPGIRDLIAELGSPGIFCAPFLRITEQRPSASWLCERLHRTQGVPLSAQLLGSHSANLAFATQVLVDAGVDVVDLNLGCPTRQALKKGVGAALLSDTKSISEIVMNMRAACRGCLSVKIRAADGPLDDVLTVAKVIEEAGADFLVIHPRTHGQGYGGVADWDVVKQVRAHVSVPVVGNGDLWYATDALRLMRGAGVAAVMIGRPALRNPYLFRQIEELRAGLNPFVPQGHHIIQHIRRLAELAKLELQRRRHGPEGALKEQIQYLLRAVPEPLRSSLRLRTMRAVGVPQVISAIEPLGDIEQLDLEANGPLRLEVSPPDPSTETGR